MLNVSSADHLNLPLLVHLFLMVVVLAVVVVLQEKRLQRLDLRIDQVCIKREDVIFSINPTLISCLIVV